jgi:AraC-like DNA-binding protein
MQATAKEKSDFIFYEQPFDTAGPQAMATLKEESAETEFPYGDLRTTSWSFDAIQVTHCHKRYNGHYVFKKENAPRDMVSLEFNLKGNYQIHHLGRIYDVRARQHNMIYSPGTSNTFSNRDLESESFSIRFTVASFLKMVEQSNPLLTHFSEKIRADAPAVLLKDSPPLHPRLQQGIAEIIHCPYEGGLRKIFLLSKCLEILVMQSEACLRKAEVPDYHCKRKEDRDRIVYAGQYLLAHLQDPPTLSELARIAGINEYKLKRGLREIHGNTVFGFLSAHRLDHARRLLLDTDKTAAEIAYELGYGSPQHFNNAFKKKFGVPPGSLQP